jgi:hypothetical protein
MLRKAPRLFATGLPAPAPFSPKDYPAPKFSAMRG